MKKRIFIYKNCSYKYFLIRQERKYISLTVEPNLRIVLKCPIDCSRERIWKFLEKKQGWVEKQIHYFEKYNKAQHEKEYVSGERFLYLGRRYRLLAVKSRKDYAILRNGKLLLYTTKDIGNKKHNKITLENWYAKKAEETFAKEYRKVLKNFNYNYEPKLAIRKMSRRWGSFFSSGKIVLNPKLIQAPKECIDYVIAHELCHVKCRNHDKKFYELLKSKVDNWKDVKEKLEMML